MAVQSTEKETGRQTRDGIWKTPAKTVKSGDVELLTTKFGNLSIGDEDQIEAESKMKIVAETEDKCGQKSDAKTYGILEFVRDKSRVQHGHIL
uniref:Uncharacterized protein n=1 Tax=Oryza sativa subsp. japonica TaxID=39947 RepID=Q2QVX9_ORYSJ|nr:hypothetical protein LOC_Os12g11270 [Oryza sativa Japonica Group]